LACILPHFFLHGITAFRFNLLNSLPLCTAIHYAFFCSLQQRKVPIQILHVNEHYSRTHYLYPYLSHRDTQNTRDSIRNSRTQPTPSDRTATRFCARQPTVSDVERATRFLIHFGRNCFFLAFLKVKRESWRTREVIRPVPPIRKDEQNNPAFSSLPMTFMEEYGVFNTRLTRPDKDLLSGNLTEDEIEKLLLC